MRKKSVGSPAPKIPVPIHNYYCGHKTSRCECVNLGAPSYREYLRRDGKKTRDD